MNDAANAAQFAHWNEVAGPKWVGLGDAMELRLNNVNELLLARAAAVAGEAVLDVGCGTGSTTLPWAAAVGAAGSVLGIDISEPMLTIARRRVADRGAGNVTLLSADAQTERLPAGRFDLLASRFGVMFFADPVAAFHNLYSTLRRGGRLCFVCWDTLVRNPHWQVPLDIVVRRLGPPGAKPARAPGPMAFSDPAYVRAILGDAGFDQVEIRREAVNVIGSTPQEEAALASIMGPAGALLDEHKADEATRHAIREAIAAAFAPYAADGRVTLPASVFVVTACRQQ